MDILIGTMIKKLRRERGLTQEEVAAHIGVSYQAISKWERGDGYPDITLLPTLAHYFGVTIDELIGTEQIADRTEYDAINREWQERHLRAKRTRDNALHQENIRLMRDALKRWPNDALLLVQLSTTLERIDGTAEEKRANLRESIMLQEQILRGEDSDVRSAALYNICFAYEQFGDHERALATAEKLPNFYKSRENAFVKLCTGKERYQTALAALTPLTECLKIHISALAETDPTWNDKLNAVLAILQ